MPHRSGEGDEIIMSQVIVVASGKGGTGKTTVCAGLAVALAKDNKKVLIMDCDSGMRGMDMVLGIEDKLVYDISDVISGECAFSDAVYRVDADLELFCIAAPLYADDEVSPALIGEYVGKARGEYDFILIDSPAGTGSGFLAAASSADRALVVVNTEPISMRGCKSISRLLTGLGISDRRLVINRFDRERFEKIGLYEDLDAVIDEAGIRLIALIPEDVRVIALSQRGALTDNWSRTGVIFDTMAKRICGVDVPVIVK